MNKSILCVVALAAFTSWPTVAHCGMEDIGRGIERPETYTAAVLTPQAVMLKFELGRIPGYRHPYGIAERTGETGWAHIDLESVAWTSIDDAKLGAFQSGREQIIAPIRDDAEAFPSLSSSGKPLEVVYSEPIVMYVDHSKPTIMQLEASSKEVLRAAASLNKSVVLPYNRFGCIALLVTGADGEARVTLIDPPWREYREWWHNPVQIALHPIRLVGAGLYVLACMFGGCH